MLIREFVTDNIHRIGLTPSERERHQPGSGVVTNGVGQRTTAHLNLTTPMRSLKLAPLPVKRVEWTTEGEIPFAGYDPNDKSKS